MEYATRYFVSRSRTSSVINEISGNCFGIIAQIEFSELFNT